MSCRHPENIPTRLLFLLMQSNDAETLDNMETLVNFLFHMNQCGLCLVLVLYYTHKTALMITPK